MNVCRDSRFYLACLIIFGTLSASADTLYLSDGSVVGGFVLSESESDIVLTNRLYGDLAVARQAVLYRETDDSPEWVDTYAITQDGMTVIARLKRSVPARGQDASSFNLLVAGNVQAVTDANGLDLPYSHRSLGDNTLVTLYWADLAPALDRLTITTVQRSVLSPTTEGQLAFRVNYALDHAQGLRVIVRYPQNFHLVSLAPAPDVELSGLLIWDKQLQRQQRFRAHLHFAP